MFFMNKSLTSYEPIREIYNYNNHQQLIRLNTEENLLTEFGDTFCETVGIDHLLKMKQITLDLLKIPDGNTLNINPLTFEDLKENRAIKGIDNEGRTFIAFKVAAYNNNDELLYQCVEFIYARDPYNTDIYVTPLQNKCDDNVMRSSHFYINERRKDFDKLTDFFNEEKVQTSVMSSGIYIKWAAE